MTQKAVSYILAQSLVERCVERAEKMSVRAVVFDMDGVLIDSEPVHIESWQILFERRGISWEGVDFQKAIGMTDEAFLKTLKDEGRFAEETRVLGLEKQEIYYDIFPSRLRPQPGVREVIRELSQKYPVALATSDWRKNAERVLGLLDLISYFTATVCRDEVKKSKPDPEIYMRAAMLLALPPVDCVAVEDSPFGIRSAKGAGMKCIGVVVSVPEAWLCQADRVVDRLVEVPRMVETLALEYAGEGK